LPAGGTLDLSNLDLSSFEDIDLTGLQNIDLSGFGGFGGPQPQTPVPEFPTPPGSRGPGIDTTTTTTTTTTQNGGDNLADLYPDATDNQDSRLDEYFRNNPNIPKLGVFTNPYYTGGSETSGTSTTPGYSGLPSGSINIPGVGNIDLSNIPGANGTTTSSGGTYSVTPVGRLQNLEARRDASLADPRVMSRFGMRRPVSVPEVSDNPFRRPESRMGIGSLATR